MILTSSVKRIALATAAAAAMVWFGAATPAEAQYYGHPGYGYAPPTYVSPKILRKQREMQKRVIQKYGYPPPAYGRGGPVYRQPRGPEYGYGGPVYRQPRPYGGPAYVEPRGYGEPVYRQPRSHGYRGEAYGQPNLGNNRVRIYNGWPAQDPH